MENEARIKLHVVLELAGDRLKLTRFGVSVPDGAKGLVSGSQKWHLLAALLLEYRIRMYAAPSVSEIEYDSESCHLPSEVFHSAWNLIKNYLNKPLPRGDESIGLLHRCIVGIRHHGDKNLSISINPQELPWGNITFALIPESGRPEIDLVQPSEWQIVLEGLVNGKVDAVRNLIQAHRPTALRQEPFRFGALLTKTYVAESFPGGIALDDVECHHVNDDFSMPPALMPLVKEACDIVARATPAGKTIVNARQFAPVKIELVQNFDDDTFERLRIWLADSHYDFYTAAAYAEPLARYDSRFEPLRQFVDQITEPRIPSPASCSMGTRIMLETKDHRLVICYRSRECKMNPDMWSSSANEGVRPILLKQGVPFNRLLEEAAFRALENELRLERSAIDRLLLLSLHQNAYAQWGATMFASTQLLFEEVYARAQRAPHRNEHNQIASLPTELGACGQEMLHRGVRWYGGALEAICTVLSWREAGAHNHVTPEGVGRILATAAKNRIIPCDEINPDFLRLSA